jgi:hypothetical protein
MSNCCLTRTDSAATELAPPGPATRASVANQMENEDGQIGHDQSYQAREIVEMVGFSHSPCISGWDAERASPSRFCRRLKWMDDLGPGIRTADQAGRSSTRSGSR